MGAALPVWAPDYVQEYLTRQDRLDKIKADPRLIYGAKQYYKDHPHDFISDWGVTYDPRNAGRNLPTTMPFVLFPRQDDFVDFLLDCLNAGENGLVEKSRDMGATWL